jgi:hypothetical protein
MATDPLDETPKGKRDFHFGEEVSREEKKEISKLQKSETETSEK